MKRTGNGKGFAVGGGDTRDPGRGARRTRFFVATRVARPAHRQCVGKEGDFEILIGF